MSSSANDRLLREALGKLVVKWRKSLGREVWAVVINNARADELEAALAAREQPATAKQANGDIGDKVDFCVRGSGRVVEKDAFYTTIATRGLEMTCWNDELTLAVSTEEKDREQK